MHRLLLFVIVIISFLAVVNGYSITCSANGLIVTCDVFVDTVPDDDIRVTWFRTSGEGTEVAQFFPVNGTSTLVTLYRFAPLQNYTIIAEVHNVATFSTTIMSGSTGLSSLDTAPIATVTGIPTYELLFFDMGNGYGFVDSTGWIVWYYDTGGVIPPQPAQAKSQLKNNGNFAFIDNGFVTEVSPSQEVIKYGTRNCSPYTNSYENHECRASADGSRVYSLQQSVINETVPWTTETMILGQIINYWSPEYNNYTNLYYSYDIWDPQTQSSRSSQGRLQVECLTNPNGPKASVVDWSHCNSISESGDNIIISSRSLSSIVSANKDGGGINWMISTEIDSDYTFPNATDQFYNQHDVQELVDGNLIMIDNGSDRPSEYGSFSRAAEYYVDHSAKTVSLIWEYLPYLPDGTAVECFHGGSVTIIPDSDIRYASFPCDSGGASCSIVAYEIGPNQSTIATMVFGYVVESGEKTVGSYRAEPWPSIAGERLIPE